MGLPGHRRTRSHKHRRAAHFALEKPAISACATCAAPVRPHHACMNCGSYRGREAVSTARAAGRLVKKASASAKAPAQTQAAPAPAPAPGQLPEKK